MSDGSATFAGNVTAPNITTLRSNVDTLQQRVADRDAVIATMTSRLAALEAAINPAPTPEPTPEPTNLIPDEWTHIEKLKALKELIAEMDL